MGDQVEKTITETDLSAVLAGEGRKRRQKA